MRQCYISNLKPGMVLGQPLHGYYGAKRTLLLGRGAEFSSQIIEKLASAGYPYVYIEEEGTEKIFPNDVLSEATRDMSMMSISQYYELTRDRIAELSQRNRNPVNILKVSELQIQATPSNSLRECTNEIIQDLFNLDSFIGYKTISGISRNNAIHSHVLNVAVISLLIGYHYGYNTAEQGVLGLSALLHDIGKTALPEIYGKQYWELDAKGMELMRHHSTLGEMILKRSRTISETVRQTVIQHHERQDGTGYPFGLKGDNSAPVRSHYAKQNHIFRFAEIIAVADAYDNLISGNFYNKRFSPKDALNELISESESALNSEVVRTLHSLVTLFPEGSNVLVEKHPDSKLMGKRGVVASSDSQDSDEVEIILLWDENGRRIAPLKTKIHKLSISVL